MQYPKCKKCLCNTCAYKEDCHYCDDCSDWEAFPGMYLKCEPSEFCNHCNGYKRAE